MIEQHDPRPCQGYPHRKRITRLIRIEEGGPLASRTSGQWARVLHRLWSLAGWRVSTSSGWSRTPSTRFGAPRSGPWRGPKSARGLKKTRRALLKNRVVLTNVYRHECPYAQVDLRAPIGFEDRTDRDCHEPAVFLRLVRQ